MKTAIRDPILRRKEEEARKKDGRRDGFIMLMLTGDKGRDIVEWDLLKRRGERDPERVKLQ